MITSENVALFLAWVKEKSVSLSIVDGKIIAVSHLRSHGNCPVTYKEQDIVNHTPPGMYRLLGRENPNYNYWHTEFLIEDDWYVECCLVDHINPPKVHPSNVPVVEDDGLYW